MLAQLLREFPGKLRVAGISATDLRQFAPNEVQPYMGQIDMRKGDAHNIEGIFEDRRFDLIVSIKTFEHLAYPIYVAEQCRRLLKPEGVALIQGNENLVLLPQLRRALVA